MVVTCGATGTVTTKVDGTVDGTAVYGTITIDVWCGTGTTVTVEGNQLTGTITGELVGKTNVGGIVNVEMAGTTVGTVIIWVLGKVLGTSVFGTITAVVFGITKTQCDAGAAVPGIITHVVGITDYLGKSVVWKCGGSGLVEIGNGETVGIIA